MIPWLLISELMCRQGQPLSALIGDRKSRFPISGEINRRVDDAAATIKLLEDRYAGDAELVEHIDGLGVEFSNWRFNVRASNTEPLLRLNVESRADPALLQEKTDELLGLIGGDPE
jgi:phosphomannomutase